MSELDKTNGQLNELQTELVDCQDALQNLVFQKSMQQLEDLSQIKKMRRNIARIKTFYLAPTFKAEGSKSRFFIFFRLAKVTICRVVQCIF